MRFGINVYQTAARYGLLEGTQQPITVDSVILSIQHIKNLGYSHYEILTDPLLKSLHRDERKILFRDLAVFNTENGLSVSVHTPFWWTDISVPDADIRNASVSQIMALMDETEVMNPTHHVIHALPRTALTKIAKAKIDSEHRQWFISEYRQTVVCSLREICKAVDASRKIAIENLQQEPDYSMLWGIAEELDLSINYDYGHQFLAEQNVYRAFEAMWPRIASIHAHNIVIEKTGIGENCTLKDHKGLGFGIINTMQIFEYLKAKAYNGLVVVEVMGEDDAADSTRFLKQHNYL